jgi:glycerol-3-phosphate dehydrogenase
VLLDHAERDGMEGFITITGGKLMTYRLMAQWATDAVCRKLGNEPCVTGREALPDHSNPPKKRCKKSSHCPRRCAVLRSIATVTAHQWLGEGRLSRSLVCECEAVTGEVQYAVET